jgi:hypothetical protein
MILRQWAQAAFADRRSLLLAAAPVCLFAYYEGSVMRMNRFAFDSVLDQPVMITADPYRSHCLAG